MKHIDSPSNPTVKSLVQLRDARERRAANCILIEGAREVARAFAAGHAIRELYLGLGVADAGVMRDLRQQAEAQGALIVTLGERAFAKASYRDTPDGVLAVGDPFRGSLQALLAKNPDLILVAEAIEKPGNLGAMLRTLDGVGASLVVCDGATDLGNPNVIRASTGAVFTVPTAICGRTEAVAALKAAGFRIVAADPAAKTPYWDADLKRKLAIVVGSEARGLSKGWLDAADLQVAIPMRGQADSLNAATSATLLLYEALRQRRK